jgi:hypothetical protein
VSAFVKLRRWLTVSDSDLHAIIADQAETIDQLRAELTETKETLRKELDWVDGTPMEPDPYWEGVYDRIRAAWDAWALAELGTSTPSPLDLAGRRELAALYETIR